MEDFRIPILGVAAGTANVGPLIRFDAASLAASKPDSFLLRPVHALECSSGGELLGLAFNDIVIGDTFLGTLDGRSVNLDAKEFLRTGRKVAKAPSPRIAGRDFRITLDGIEQPFGMLHGCARPESILPGAASHKGAPPEEAAPLNGFPVQIVASPLNNVDFYRGKAAAGALCNAPWQEKTGVVALCDRIWVSMEAQALGFCRTEQLLIGPGERVGLEGLTEDGQVILDGNPHLRAGDIVELGCRPTIIDAVHNRYQG